MKDLSEIFNALLNYYQPAESTHQADELLSTADITEFIVDHTGEAVEPKLVFDYLETNGFHFEFTNEGFRWLMKIASKQN